MDKTKHISQSKTLWFNLGLAALAVLTDHTDLLRSSLPDGGYLVVMMLASAGNIYLRTVTTSGVRLTKPVVSPSATLRTGEVE